MAIKYKALLTGKNNSVIDDFFNQMYENFEVLTTSTRYDDIIRHIRYFSPHVFIYCLYNEPRDNYSQMAEVKYRLRESRIPFVLIGTKEDCDEFERISVNVADLCLQKPLSAGSITERLMKYLAQRVPEPVAEDTEEPFPVPDFSEKPSVRQVPKEEDILDRLAALERLTREAEAEPAAAEPESARRKHILVIDDDPMMLKLLKEHLHDEYDIATAISGKIAMKFLERKRTDLILLDYEMPVENGPAVLEKLRANEATKDLPVIFLTGVSDREKIQEALVLKPQGYLLKPVEREKLLEIIIKTLG